MRIITLPEGPACLNIGCGTAFSPAWTNLDRVAARGVAKHDVRRPLPFPDAAFDAVYSSHLLEHLTPAEAGSLVREMNRVLKPGGVCRIVVPDLEAICQEYLRCLDEATADPAPQPRRRYDWIVLELLDQMVRDRPGGLMMEVLESGAFDESFVRRRMGDQFSVYYDRADRAPQPAGGFAQRVKSALKTLATGERDPRRTGEAHKWMYDRFSLSTLMIENGFVDPAVMAFDRSNIPFWTTYNLDKSLVGDRPRKPDSLFFECRKASIIVSGVATQ